MLPKTHKTTVFLVRQAIELIDATVDSQMLKYGSKIILNDTISIFRINNLHQSTFMVFVIAYKKSESIISAKIPLTISLINIGIFIESRW